MLFIQQRVKNHHYIVDSFNVNPVYLRHNKQGMIPDYRHWQIPLGRRFRSLKMWFVFRIYGVKNLQNHIRKQVWLAHQFKFMVSGDSRFEITHPVILGLVCFRLKGTNELNEKFVNTINDRKNIHLTPTKIDDRFIVRFAVCARTTELADIQYSFKEIQEVAKIVVEK
ncbi:aromatic-L-amino-acid decarboxylase-like protein [Leptotrombidium deliense]|uniref:Aromatic-L-amino-acid decarboxylase n=1 Tax=Leptotrombidium deliense TaxID=299467 RepID=A0A443SCL2_9ACAR|nr:aromatic-L-amino-acid decarboxylase-like protein [Leptotrombidium deliense]